MLNEGGRLKPSCYWLEGIIGRHEPGYFPAICVLVFSVANMCIFGLMQWGGPGVFAPTWWSVILLTILMFVALAGLDFFSDFKVKHERTPIFSFSLYCYSHSGYSSTSTDIRRIALQGAVGTFNSSSKHFGQHRSND